MRRNGIYSATIKREKPIAKILAIVFAVVVAMLLVFIVWSALTFSNSDQKGYVPQAEEISNLKIELETKNLEVTDLRAENEKLKSELQEARAMLDTTPDETVETVENVETENPDEAVENPDETVQNPDETVENQDDAITEE